MTNYQLRFSPSFDKNLRKIHPQDKQRVLKEVQQLSGNPFPGGKKVKHLINTKAFRLRVGKTRVIFFVDEAEKTIYFEDIAYRKDIY